MPASHALFRSRALAVLLAASGVACAPEDPRPPPVQPPPGPSTSTGASTSSGSGGSGAAGGAGPGGAGGAGGSEIGGAGGAGGTETGGAGGIGAGGAGGSGGLAPGDCDDGAKNGAETDLDCGGPVCAPCEITQGCVAASDCVSKKCAGGICIAPTCEDGVTNGAETDLDCGGPNCQPCADGKLCSASDDCKSDVCDGTCQEPTCADGVRNGSEDDVDCGSGCAARCALGKKCNASSDCSTEVCGGDGTCACPKNMKKAPASGGGSYCIDVTEVSYVEYETFLGANPQSVDPACAWNETYVPLDHYPPSSPRTQYHPVTDVDWCDASEYCRFRGKHLCGAMSGGALAFDASADAEKSEWFSACSAQGTKAYPYSGPYKPGACNGADAALPGPVAVLKTNLDPEPTACEGGLTGLFHMSGNVREWENACEATTGAGDACRTRGGSHLGAEADLACAAATAEPRQTTAGDLGFRCCL